MKGVLGDRCWVLGVRCWVLGVKCWVLDVGMMYDKPPFCFRYASAVALLFEQRVSRQKAEGEWEQRET
jgi:hypothetical protein